MINLLIKNSKYVRYSDRFSNKRKTFVGDSTVGAMLMRQTSQTPEWVMRRVEWDGKT